MATKRPTALALTMLDRIVSKSPGAAWKPSTLGVNSAGITLPPAKPSSTTSVKRTFGVKMERTRASSIASSAMMSLVIFSIVCMNGTLNMLPLRSITATSTRLAPPNSAS